SAWMRAGRFGIPAREIEDPLLARRRRLAPRIRTFGPIGSTKRGPLELGLRHQTIAAPTRERRSLRVTHIHGPRRRQRHEIEQAPPCPSAGATFPEERMAHAIRLQPCPGVGIPPAFVAVAAGFDELEKILVGHVVALNGKSADLRPARGPLVVPAERG